MVLTLSIAAATVQVHGRSRVQMSCWLVYLSHVPMLETGIVSLSYNCCHRPKTIKTTPRLSLMMLQTACAMFYGLAHPLSLFVLNTNKCCCFKRGIFREIQYVYEQYKTICIEIILYIEIATIHCQ